MNHPEARAILAEFGITPVPPSAHTLPGQTKAVANLQKIVRARGYDHARFVIMLWKETNIRKTILDAPTMWALSDTVILVDRNFPRLLNEDVEEFFKFIDRMQIGWLQNWARETEGVIPRRFAIGGMIYERIVRIFRIEQADFLDDRRAT